MQIGNNVTFFFVKFGRPKTIVYIQSMSICLICLQLYRSDRKDQASYEKYLSSSVSIQLKNDVVEVWKKNC